jgi:thiol-disulfide isomerase/thioredoxin
LFAFSTAIRKPFGVFGDQFWSGKVLPSKHFSDKPFIPFQRLFPLSSIRRWRNLLMVAYWHEKRRLLACAVLSLAIVFVQGCSRSSLDSERPAEAGTSAPLMQLADLEGKTVRLQDFGNKVVLLNFWGTTCAPCKKEIPWLVEFQENYGSKGLQVVAVAMYGEGPDVLKTYVKEHRMQDFQVLIGNNHVAAQFGVAAFPTTFIVDRKGKISSKHFGLIDRSSVEAELAALLK